MNRYKKPLLWVLACVVGILLLNMLDCVLFQGWSLRRMALLVEVQLIAMVYYFYRYGHGFLSYIREHRKAVGGFLLVEGLTLMAAAREIGRTSGSVRLYMALIFLILMVAVFWGFMLLFVQKCPLWKTYMVVGFLVGCSYMLLIPLYVAPDEPSHLWKAYAVSDHILGTAITDENGYVYGRQDDAEFTVLSVSYDMEQYTRYVESFDAELGSTDLTPSTFYCLPGHDYQYMAQAIGITTGRILGWNAASTLLMGRFCGLLLFILFTTFAIYTIPFGGAMLFGVALFPMTMQQAMSYSYDSFFIGIMFAFSALILKRFYTEEKQLSIWEYILMAACMLFILPMKSYAYFAVALLPVGLLLAEWLRKKGISVGRVLCLMILAALVAAGGIFILGRLGKLPSAIYNIFYSERMVEYAGEAGYNIGFFIDHPARLYNVFMDTLNSMVGFYLSSTIGRKLGWFELNYPAWVYCGWVVFVGLMFITFEKNRMSVEKVDRWIGYLAAIVAALCVMAGMLLHWTPISTFTIQGVQGRYFIPLIPLTFFVLRQKIYTTRLEEQHTKGVLLFGLMLSVFTIETVFDCMWM